MIMTRLLTTNFRPFLRIFGSFTIGSGHFRIFWGIFSRVVIQIWGLFDFDSISFISLIMPRSNFTRIGWMFYFQHLEFEKCCYQLSIKEIIIITRERNAIKASALVMRARRVISAKSPPLRLCQNWLTVCLIDFWCKRVKGDEYSWR